MPDTSLIGLTLANRFRISGVIGEGGMATVYRGAAPGQSEEVAIKIMNPDLAKEGRFVRRFRREAKAASMLKHPNTVKILEFGVDQGYVFLAMELLKGFDLAMLLHRERKIKEARAVQIVVQVCRALSAAHDQSIIHRDLKPDNIMLIPQPAGQPVAVAGLAPTDFVKVLDFGIAKILDEDMDKPAVDSRAEPITQEKSMLTRVGTIVGTPAYMAPEQGRAEAVDARTDLYACGVLLYELITGRVPFTGETPMQVVMRHVNEPPRPPSDYTPVHPELEKLIMRALAKYASERQQSADEMANELLSVLPQLSPPAEDDMSAVKRTLVLDRAPSTNFGPPRPAAGAPAVPRPAAGAPPPPAAAAAASVVSNLGAAASMSISGSAASPFPTLNIEVPDDIFPDNFGAAAAPAPSTAAATRRIDPPAGRAPLPAPRPAAGMSAAAAVAPAPVAAPTPAPRHALEQTMQSEGSLPPPPPSEDEEEAATFIKAPTEENRSRMSHAEEQMAQALGAGLPSFSGPETVEPTLVAKGGGTAPAPAPAVRVQPHPQEKTVLTNPVPPVPAAAAAAIPSVVVATLPTPPGAAGATAAAAAAGSDLKNLQATLPLEPEQVEKAIQDALAARTAAPKPPSPAAANAHASTVIVPESAAMPKTSALPAASTSSNPPRPRHPTSELIPVHLPEESSSAAIKAQDLPSAPAQPEAPLVWEPKGRKLSGGTALVVGIAIGAIVVALAIGLIFLFGGNS